MSNLASALGAVTFAVPRHHFIPAQGWAWPTAGIEGFWIDRGRDLNRWWRAVYSDTVIVTQIDDGAMELTEENLRKTFNYTCSSSGPSLVFAFLALLDAQPGHRVLEIGTGTGWTAGLLSHLVGEEHVTSVEIDETLAATAMDSLTSAGLAPHLIVGDGAEGAPPKAPFDRVHVTCGVRDIPYSWVAQTRPGGMIVMPWMANNRVLRLTVHDDGTATGDFHDECAFMPMRSQRQPESTSLPDDEREQELEIFTARSMFTHSPGWSICLMELVGDLPFITDYDHGSLVTLRVGTSLAQAHLTPTGARVTQRGPRNLWDEAERAHHLWTEWGCPGIDRFGISVTPEGQYVWLDEPQRPVTPLNATCSEAM